MGRWGSEFDPVRLAALETRMWKAYYRRQPVRRLRVDLDGGDVRVTAGSSLSDRPAGGR